MAKRKRNKPRKYRRFSNSQLLGAFSEDTAKLLVMFDTYLETNYKAIYGLEFMLDNAPEKISPEAKQFIVNYVKTKTIPNINDLIEKLED